MNDTIIAGPDDLIRRAIACVGTLENLARVPVTEREGVGYDVMHTLGHLRGLLDGLMLHEVERALDDEPTFVASDLPLMDDQR